MRERGERPEQDAAHETGVVAEHGGEHLVLPLPHDALPVVDDEVDACVAGADVAGQPHLRAEALTDDVAERLQVPDLGRRFEPRPLRDDVRAAGEEAARRRQLARRLEQGLATGLADRVAHDQQVAAGDDPVAVAVGGLVDEVVDHDEVAGIQQVVEAADAGVGEDAPDAGPVQDAEDLTRRASARDSAAPAVHAHVESATPADLEQREGRTLTPRRLEHQAVVDETGVGMQAARELRGQRTGTADEGERRLGDLYGHRQYPASSGVTRRVMSCTWSPVSDV